MMKYTRFASAVLAVCVSAGCMSGGDRGIGPYAVVEIHTFEGSTVSDIRISIPSRDTSGNADASLENVLERLVNAEAQATVRADGAGVGVMPGASGTGGTGGTGGGAPEAAE